MKQNRILIVGAGFSGTIVAAHLLRSGLPLEIFLVDSNASRGRGVAYKTGTNRHLLNVPACSMSAFQNEPKHFLNWALQRDPSVKSYDYLSRELYGDYLEEILEVSIRENASAKLIHLTDEVVDFDESNSTGMGMTAMLRSGAILNVDSAVFAIGNFPPARLSTLSEEYERHPGYFANPWDTSWRNRLKGSKSLVVIGTGLTAADVIVEAVGQGFSGEIHAISRFGHLPKVHLQGDPTHGHSPMVDAQGSLREKVALLRRLTRERVKAGGKWQEVMDDIRPYVQHLWRGLTFKEQKRFIRHIRPFWDIHRHRIAPQISAVLEKAVQDGLLRIHAGMFSKFSFFEDRIEVYFRQRGSKNITKISADTVINCTGPKTNVNEIDSPILQALLRRGIVTADLHGTGLRCTEVGAILRKDNTPSENIFTLGAMRRGELWESIAVRELRVQALEIAEVIKENFLFYNNIDSKTSSSAVSRHNL